MPVIGSGEIGNLDFQSRERAAPRLSPAVLKERAIDAACLLAALAAASTLAGALLAAAELPSLDLSAIAKVRSDVGPGAQGFPRAGRS